MDTIIKKITLNDFKNYNPNVNIKCLDEDEYGCWNKIPMDLIVMDETLKTLNTLPFVKKFKTSDTITGTTSGSTSGFLNGELSGLTTGATEYFTYFRYISTISDDLENFSESPEYYVLRYYNLKQLYLFFDKYERSMIYYRLTKVHGVKKWIKCAAPTEFNRSLIFSTLPSVDDYECGIIIATNVYQDLYLMYTNNGDIVIENKIKTLLWQYFNNDKTLQYDIPYINIPLFITSSISDCGDMLNTLQKWSPNKNYYTSDIVFYNNEYYVANKDTKSKVFNHDDWVLINLKTPKSSNVENFNAYSKSKLNNFVEIYCSFLKR